MTDKCTSPEGHREYGPWKIRYSPYWAEPKVERTNGILVEEMPMEEVHRILNEHAELKDEIRRHEEVFQFSANKIAALKRGIVEYAAMKQYLRAGPDGSTKPMWHDVDEEEKERYRESVRDVLLTAEEQDDE